MIVYISENPQRSEDSMPACIDGQLLLMGACEQQKSRREPSLSTHKCNDAGKQRRGDPNHWS